MNANAPVFTPKLLTQSTFKPNIDRPKKPGHKHNKERLPRGSINQRDPGSQSSGQKNRSSTQRGRRSHDQVNSRSKATLGCNLVTVSVSNTSSHDKSEVGEPNKRGQISMNHLLNFSLPPRQRPVSFAPRKSRTVHHQPFNKERFVNANFRFLVNPTGDYTVQLADPDVSIQWEDIEQVVITSQSLTTCPICLSKPCAARVTKCGHTYCYPCILHYLSVGEDKKIWRKCPVCWDAIYEKDLKSVQHREGLFLMRNDVKKNLVTFNLMQRPSTSNIVLPRTSMCKLRQVISPETPFIPWDFTPSALSYSRLILPTLSYMEKEYIQAISELEDALKDAKGWGANEELLYIDNSLEKTKSQLKFLRLSSVRESIEKIAAINMLRGTESVAQPFTNSKISTEAQEDEFEAVINSYRENNKVHESAFSDCEDEHIHVPNSVNHHSIEISASTPYGALFNGNLNKEANDLTHQGINSQEAGAKHEALVSDYFFYQSADGQHMYLHPIDVKILREEFGAYENFPDEISAPMIGFEESTINPDLRRRFKYLSHLPISCDITFVEIDLKNLVSKKTLNMFSDELRQRESKKTQKNRKEERQRQLAEVPLYKPERNAVGRRPISNDPFFQIPTSNSNNTIHSPQKVRSVNTENSISSQGPDRRGSSHDGSFAKVLESPNPLKFGQEEVLVGKKGKKKHVLMSNNARRRY